MIVVTQAEPLAAQRRWPTQMLFGFGVHALTMDEVLSIVDETIRERSRLLIGAVNAAKIVNMRRDALLRDSVLSSDLILADGMAVVGASRLLGRPLPERVAGIDLMHRILDQGARCGYRIYCLGAAQAVLDAAVARMETDHPGLLIVGRHHGYFSEAEEPELVASIRAAEPDVLFVAMSPPKKEIFLGRWAAELNVPVCHGVGGAFDVVAGKVKRAPVSWQRFGLEWLFRVVQEPKRMWRRYAATNTLFCWMVLLELFGRRRAMRS